MRTRIHTLAYPIPCARTVRPPLWFFASGPPQDVCLTAFRVFDRNGDGKISPDELKLVLKDDSVQGVAGAQTVAELLQEVDQNGDGMIDFQEFLAMMARKNF